MTRNKKLSEDKLKNNPEKFKIIEALMSDVLAIQSCVKSAYQHYVDRIGKEPGPMIDDYHARVSQNDAFVIKDEDRVIGVLVLILDHQRCLLDNVAVDPQYAGNGLGKKLVEFAERFAKERKYQEIELYTHELMDENIEMYQKWGYRVVRKVSECGFNRIYMAKKL